MSHITQRGLNNMEVWHWVVVAIAAPLLFWEMQKPIKRRK